MIISEPFKIKEVKNLPERAAHERQSILQNAGFNTARVPADTVTFDLVARGMSAWSHYQKAGYMIGDEAYAGSRNYLRLQKVAGEVLGIDRLVPTHNGIGAEKLLVTTVMGKGARVLHNRGRVDELVVFNGGISTDVTGTRAREYGPPDQFGADLDLDRVTRYLREGDVAYIHVSLCPDAWNGQTVSLANLHDLRNASRASSTPLVIDISNILENALWNCRVGGHDDLLGKVREIIALADLTIMDAAQGARADIGGFIASPQDALFEKLRNQVVVFEGLHTYGGMTGRAMEVFAVGIEEMARAEYTAWYDAQVEHLYRRIAGAGVPVFRGAKGAGLDVGGILPHLGEEDCPKLVLDGCLYIAGGIRARITGDADFHLEGEGRRVLSLELPRHAYTRNQIAAIADTVADVAALRDEIFGLERIDDGAHFIDELDFRPKRHRLFVHLPEKPPAVLYEPYKIAIFEPISTLDKERRKAAMEAAGYNTFLLRSEDVTIDLLTDSGTTAMSCHQWEGMTNTIDSAYTSRHYTDLVRDFREILGYRHIIPTHQGRAAEHIMSTVMIENGMSVPGNMYFTTTKLHQEMAGGIFVDVIVDEAHDPRADYPWKGNIDPAKLGAEIDRVGADRIAYVSFEMSVNMAGGQPFSMENAREISALCQHHGIPLMYDATRCVENARMIQLRDPAYAGVCIRDILHELMSYGDGCTISCKKDFMVNMGGILACNDDDLAARFRAMMRVWEGDFTTGGLDTKDLEALRRGLLESLDDHYIASRVEQTRELGQKLIEAGIPIVHPPGSHAIFLNAREFLPHLDSDDYPAQALAAAIYIQTGVRAMERGNVSKGRNPETGENYRPALELVRLTIPRRVYTNAHFDFVVDGLRHLWENRDHIGGLEMTYEPKVLRFFQARFTPKPGWQL